VLSVDTKIDDLELYVFEFLREFRRILHIWDATTAKPMILMTAL